MGSLRSLLLLFVCFLMICELHGGNAGRGHRKRTGKPKRSQCPHLRNVARESKVHRNKRAGCPYTQISCNANEKYRTSDGSCNNLVTNTLWGMAGTPDVRMKPSTYQDGTSAPKTLTSEGLPLPTARKVSTMILQDDEFENIGFFDQRITHLVMQWGQFLDHDITRTPTQEEADGSEPICCVDDLPSGDTRTQTDLDSKEECFAMSIDTTRDRHFTRSCMNFVRSEQTTPIDCSEGGPAEQMNLITTYIDGSQVYGSSDTEMNNLRNSTKSGFLSTSDNNLLPHVDSGVHCVTEDDSPFCFLAGDVRVNVQGGLMALQTIFMREHNRIAEELYKFNWDDDKVFKETRKIIGALIQHITYNEYLPLIMGDEFAKYDLQVTASGFGSNIYDPSIDPSISTEFATAAYRFGHSQIQSYFTRNFGDFNDSTLLSEMYGRTKFITEDAGAGLDRIINGLLMDFPERADRWYSLQVTDWLFAKSANDALDLGALNVQRARDHGLATYNDMREFCGFTRATSFLFNVTNGLTSHTDVPATRISRTYSSPADIDLYPGGISEVPVTNGKLGPTFVCILGHQFEKLRKGDRFWYENNSTLTGFTEDQLNSIKGMSLSKVICENTNIKTIVPSAFQQPTARRNGQPVDCSLIPGLDLTLWNV